MSKLTKKQLISISPVYKDFYGNSFDFAGIRWFIGIRNKTKPTKPRLYAISPETKRNTGLFYIGEGKLKGSANGKNFLLLFENGTLTATEKGANVHYEVNNEL